jgi:hypothetical protein
MDGGHLLSNTLVLKIEWSSEALMDFKGFKSTKAPGKRPGPHRIKMKESGVIYGTAMGIEVFSGDTAF